MVGLCVLLTGLEVNCQRDGSQGLFIYKNIVLMLDRQNATQGPRHLERRGNTQNGRFDRADDPLRDLE